MCNVWNPLLRLSLACPYTCESLCINMYYIPILYCILLSRWYCFLRWYRRGCSWSGWRSSYWENEEEEESEERFVTVLCVHALYCFMLPMLVVSFYSVSICTSLLCLSLTSLCSLEEEAVSENNKDAGGSSSEVISTAAPPPVVEESEEDGGKKKTKKKVISSTSSYRFISSMVPCS